MNCFSMSIAPSYVPMGRQRLRFARILGNFPRWSNESLTYGEVGQIFQEAAQSAQRQGKELEGKTLKIMAMMAGDVGDTRFDKPLAALIGMANTLAPFLTRTPLVEKLYRLAHMSPDTLPPP